MRDYTINNKPTQHTGYHAPMDVYKALNGQEIFSYINQLPEVTEVNVCVGKEWHRFPSSFFLPNKKLILTKYLLCSNQYVYTYK